MAQLHGSPPLTVTTQITVTMSWGLARRYFNSVQSECFPQAYGSDVNMVSGGDVGQQRRAFLGCG